jgi:CheY-like chemotaxis protein
VRCTKLEIPRPTSRPAREIAHGAGLSKPISYLDMILVVATVTYFCNMHGFSPAGNSPRRRPQVEDQQLQDAPIISIIDDDESMRCAMKSLVTSLGLDAYTFASAEAFLQSPHLEHTSCVITDLQMPGLNGVELQKSLLAQGRRIPIIFVTAFPEERLRARAIEAGALGFLSKPFESETLIKLIDKAIETGRKT